MRAVTVLAALSLLLASVPALAQDAMPATNPVPPPMPEAPATPVASANPAPAAPASVLCEYKEHQGDMIPLRNCVSRDEATRRRIEQQESIREFQMQSLMQQPH